MTIELGSQKVGRIGRRGGARNQTPSQMPIGETDANIFACPACSRPLGVGTSRCPSCSTRLVAGVKVSRAVAFVALGIAVGMIASGGLMALTSTAARPAPVAVVLAPPVVAPSTAPIASAAAPAPVANPGIPSGAISALRQSTLLNQRLVGDADRLTAAIAASRPSVTEIAAALRSMASTSAFGLRLAPSVGEWDKADVVSKDLRTFYGDIGRTAQDALSASMSNDRAYVAAAAKMLAIVAGLDKIDTASRELAASADIELPPLTGATN